MYIKAIDQGFEVYLNERLFIRHTRQNPAFFLGQKNMRVNMKHGAFEIADDTTYDAIKNVEIKQNEIIANGLSMICETTTDGLHHLRFSLLDQAIKIRVIATKDERVYGGGEQFTALDLRGHKVKNWVEEHITRKQIYSKILRQILGLKAKQWPFEDYRTYFVTPTFVSSQHYFFDADTDYYATFDFKHQDYHELTFLQMPQDIVIGDADSLLSVVAMLAKHKGMTPPLPDWVYDGMILAIQGGSETVSQKLEIMLARGALVNAVWSQDWCGELYTFFGKQVRWNWQVDETLYPNLSQHIEDWAKKGVRFLGYVNPYLKAEEPLFTQALDKDYLVKNMDGSVFLTKATSFDFGIVDLTNPEAYNWFKQVIRTEMMELGMMGWMADFGEYLPFDCILFEGSGQTAHNAWPDLWIKLNRELLEESGQLGQMLFFNRAGYKDNLKYTTLIWGGDQHTDFSDDFGLPSALRAMLSLAFCGAGLSHSDVGGYTTVPSIKRSKELYLRWLEMNAFTPVLRGHEGNKPWKNVQFDKDDDTIEATIRWSVIHHNLKPYFKAVEDQYQTHGFPMIRPLMMHSDIYSDRCFMIGSDLLVWPVLKAKQKTLKVTLPASGWIHLWTGKVYPSGDHQIETPPGKPAVFYRQSSTYASLFEDIKALKTTTT